MNMKTIKNYNVFGIHIISVYRVTQNVSSISYGNNIYPKLPTTYLIGHTEKKEEGK